MGIPFSEQELSGWGRHPVEQCRVYRPDSIDATRAVVECATDQSLIPRGNGRSYGDASLNAGQGVVCHERMTRFLAFDPATGVLHCEAGVGMWEVIETFLPRGFFFPVTPGTKRISVGGAIAADVHGKNHHRDGTISRHLIELRLMLADGSICICSRTENESLFWATIGGMGLTGIIVDARLRLRPVETAFVEADTERTRDLESTLIRMSESDSDFDYSVAWIDCLARGRSMGRSVLLRANPAPIDALPRSAHGAPLALERSWRPRVPFDLPSFVLNDWSMSLFNSAFYRAHQNGRSIVGYDRYFYPLDAVGDWNRIYGKRGALQYQAVIPTTHAHTCLVRMIEKISTEGGGSFLAVLKSMGPEDEAPLGFPMEGMTLSLDFAYTGPELIARLHELDELVAQSGGRVYLAKDACLQRDHLRTMYPRLDQFLAVKRSVDPNDRFSSSLARRLGLVATR